MHRAQESPVSSAEHQQPEQQSTSPPQPSTQQQPDVRPIKDPEDSDWRIEEPVERAQETEQRPDVHNTGEATKFVKSHKTPEQGAAPSIIKDPTVILVGEGLQKYEGEEPRMWSTAEVAAAAQRDRDREGATGPYIPSSSASERSTENEATADAKQNFPVMNPDTIGGPGCVKQGTQRATVATGVAGAEHKTRTGHRYNQISSSHVEPEITTLEETHTCEGGGMPLEGWVTTVQEEQHPGLSEQSSVRQTSVTKLSAEVELENGAGSVANFSEIQEDSNSPLKSREEHRDGVQVAESLPDVRTDHPTSTFEVQYDDGDVRLIWFSSARKEVPEGATEPGSVEPIMDFEESDSYAQQMAGHGSAEPDEDYGVSDVNNTDTVVSESRNVSNEALDMDEWSSKGQRPTHFKHSELETKFRPGERRRRCNGLGRGDQAGSDISNVSSFNKYVRKAKVRFRLGRESNRSSSRKSTYRRGVN